MRTIKQVWTQGRAKLIIGCLAFAASAVFPLGAGAAQTDPFSPELLVSSSTYRAGANPTLAVGYSRKNNEQDVKRMTVQFPPGLVADANAAPYCDPYRGFSVPLPTSMPNYETTRLYGWLCHNPDALVGTTTIVAKSQRTPDGGPESAWMTLPGTVYNASPKPGYQGRLLFFVAGGPSGELGFPAGIFVPAWGIVEIDISVSGPNLRMVTDATNIPDRDNPDLLRAQSKFCRDRAGNDCDDIMTGYIPVWVTDFGLTLRGAKGANRGHPLLTNTSSCNPQKIQSDFMGYEMESFLSYPGGGTVTATPGLGIGKAFSDSAPYTATSCDALPYSPNFTATSDTDAPGKPVALSTVITQKDDGATTKKVDVEFPKGMGINIGTTLKPCTAETPNRSNCPDSLMGTVEAESRLLPVNPPNNGPLKGDVFLTGQKGNRLSLAVLLSGFIDLRLDATAGVDSSGRLTATFDDLPSVPLSKFTLNLAGGDKSLITNPRRCGDLTTKATFTSHSGKTRVVSVPAAIKGCSAPAFDVELSEPGKGKRTGIELEIRSDEKPIKEVKFGIDRHMLLSAKGLGKKRKFGEISVTSDSGMKEAALKRPVGVKQKKKKGFSLKVSALEGLGVNIYRKRFTRKGVKNFKNKKNKKALKKKTVLKNRVSVKPLPKDGLTKVSVSLNPDEAKLLRNGKNKCRANFIALVKTTDGVKYALKQTVKLRGKGCSKKKKKKKKS